jgi:SAM-dependent methyltransferase
MRFAFGENWHKFSQSLDQEQLLAAEDSLVKMIGLKSLSGLTFVDIGCGSGIFSLAAVNLGAEKTVSFDIDPKNVHCASQLKEKKQPARNWEIKEGSALDREFLRSLGQFDIVYSWGVLHHTGSLWPAVDNACSLVRPEGKLFIALYNDQGILSKIWKIIKKTYVRLPGPLKPVLAVAIIIPFEVKYFLARVFRGKESSLAPRERGMKWWYDWIDWIGGYPFETAKPETVISYLQGKGFVLERAETCDTGWGNNEFVFRLAGK